LQVHPGGGDDRLYQASQLPVVHVADGGAKAPGHFDLLVRVACAAVPRLNIFPGPAYRPGTLRVAIAAMRRARRRAGGRPPGRRRMACLEPMLSRRQLLAASPTTLPLFLALSACKGPAVLSAPPTVSPQTRMLLHAVTAERNLILIYNKAMAAYSGLAPTLAPLRAEHEAHLTQL